MGKSGLKGVRRTMPDDGIDKVNGEEGSKKKGTPDKVLSRAVPPPPPPPVEITTDAVSDKKRTLPKPTRTSKPTVLDSPPGMIKEKIGTQLSTPTPDETKEEPPDEEEGPEGSDEEKKEGKNFSNIKDSFIRFIKGRPKEVIATKMAITKIDEEGAFGEGMELMETIELTRHVKVQIFLDPETSDYYYNPVEPLLGPKQEMILDFIMVTLNKALSYNENAREDPEEKKRFLDQEVTSILKDYTSRIGAINDELMDPIHYYLQREFLGYGRIHSIMLDRGVEDVSCDGTGIPIFVYHRDFGSIRTTIQFETDEELEGFVVSLAQRAGKSISVALPILDATLPEGHRLNSTFGREVTTRGSSFTIRKFKEDPLTITDLVKFGTLSPEMAAHFWLTVQYGESVIFAGGTASGKTATMNAISIFIPTSAKIISIEDTREVNLPHKNWIAGITRGSAEGGRETDIDMYQLLRAALRQRPEYVIVGEVRGKETMTMFQAMATGHTTYSTMHADSVKSIVYRLENPPISIPRVLIQALNLVAIHNQIRVKGMRVRRITELVEIVGIEPTSLEIITNRVYKWEAAGDHFTFGGHSNLYEKVMDFEDMTRDEVITELSRRSEIIEWMLSNDVRKFQDVSTIVAEYYEDPDKVISIIRDNRDIDIDDGLHLFEGDAKERLPPSTYDSLPSPGGSENDNKTQPTGGV